MTVYNVVKADQVLDNLFGLGFSGWAVRTTTAGAWQHAPEQYVQRFIAGHQGQLDQVAQVALTDADSEQLRGAGFQVLRCAAKRSGWALGPVGHCYQVVDRTGWCADFATLDEAIAFVDDNPRPTTAS